MGQKAFIRGIPHLPLGEGEDPFMWPITFLVLTPKFLTDQGKLNFWGMLKF